MSLSTINETVDQSDFFMQKFCDYKSLQKGLDEWCVLNYVQLSKRTCPKIRLETDKSNENEFVHRVYESLYYGCIHYGQPRVTKSDSIPSLQRPQQVYNACGCKCFFHYKWKNNNFFLYNYNKEHLNHPETKEHWVYKEYLTLGISVSFNNYSYNNDGVGYKVLNSATNNTNLIKIEFIKTN